MTPRLHQTSIIPQVCPLCQSDGNKYLIFETRKKRRYWHCRFCDLVFVDRDALPTLEQEREIYVHHQNSPDHPGYVAFLQRIIQPAQAYLTPTMRGLDYGCGPGPTLSVLLGREGIHCHNYDPIFFPERPQGPFDFIFATECFEHFHSPATELSRLIALLPPGGYLFVMTERWHEQIDFRTWYYKADPTHVSFYHLHSFDYICRQYGFSILACHGSRILLLQKNKP
ncbi:class I SAM-dependent methyltransferase [Pelovirga terrestris]|uniref:Class I SAM-dependent methyltransferase n=1 Tax=Pelovirga terrestris TaxID=2771352 RepID=A0A8J6QY59_9BACT|nr:class I SAM-dependent methyltransferase [Pelovirga terrestris]MBD1401481.1 class I SAM-dependent methyltransferase [Pelovirga terrestris]